MSKKYVIEIKPEYEDTTRGIMVLGSRDSNLYVDALAVEDLEELNSDYINEHFSDLQDTAYQRGVEDGQNETWEAAKKIEFGTSNGGITTDVMMEIFGTYVPNKVLRKFTAAEAIAKLKAYEEKQKADDEIKVGDEVEILGTGNKYFIVGYEDDCICGFAYGGKTCRVQPVFAQKTGKHIDIDKILEEMKK